MAAIYASAASAAAHAQHGMVAYICSTIGSLAPRQQAGIVPAAAAVGSR
jgi:hypothetical protein